MANDINVPTQPAQSSDIVTRQCCDVRPCGCADARMVIDHLHAEIERLRVLLDAIDALHQSDPALGGECTECFHGWSCPTARLLHPEEADRG